MYIFIHYISLICIALHHDTYIMYIYIKIHEYSFNRDTRIEIQFHSLNTRKYFSLFFKELNRTYRFKFLYHECITYQEQYTERRHRRPKATRSTERGIWCIWKPREDAPDAGSSRVCAFEVWPDAEVVPF